MEFEHYDGRKKGQGGSDLYCIYKLSHGHMIYIGYTKRTSKRFKKHRGKSSGCRYIRNAIQNHGWGEFQTTILETDLTKEEACFAEEYYVDLYDCIAPNGYNLTTGGESYELSDDSLKRMSEATKKQWEDEDFRNMRKEAAKKQWADPEFRKQASEIRKKITEEEFTEAFEKFKGDKKEIMKALDLCNQSFYRYMKRCDISLEKISRLPVNYIRKITDDEVFLETNERLDGNIPLLAEEFNVSISTIKEHRKRLGLSRAYNRKICV